MGASSHWEDVTEGGERKRYIGNTISVRNTRVRYKGKVISRARKVEKKLRFTYWDDDDVFISRGIK